MELTELRPVVADGYHNAFTDLAVILHSVTVPSIHIADGQYIAEVSVPASITCSHTADTDAANARPVVLCLVGKHGFVPGKVRNSR